MKEQDQIKAIAELDGKYPSIFYRPRLPQNPPSEHDLPDYLHSRDAIIPVIEKHIRSGNYNSDQTHMALELVLGEPCKWMDFACATPQQLAEALLRATNKWVEE